MHDWYVKSKNKGGQHMKWWGRFVARVDDFHEVLFSELDGLVVKFLLFF